MFPSVCVLLGLHAYVCIKAGRETKGFSLWKAFLFMLLSCLLTKQRKMAGLISECWLNETLPSAAVFIKVLEKKELRLWDHTFNKVFLSLWGNEKLILGNWRIMQNTFLDDLICFSTSNRTCWNTLQRTTRTSPSCRTPCGFPRTFSPPSTRRLIPVGPRSLHLKERWDRNLDFLFLTTSKWSGVYSNDASLWS